LNLANKYFKLYLLDRDYNGLNLISISFFFLLIVGLVDYFTGAEISFLSFYLFPIFCVSMHPNSTKRTVVINASIATIIWYVSEFLSRPYSNELIPIWNAFVRFSIFLSFGLLLNLLKERYAKIEKINQKLQKLNDEKNRFIGIAAHDLKNPIGTISSFSELLISDYSDKMNDEVNEMIGYIKELSGNSMHILNNVLDVSIIESGIVEIKKKRHDYVEFIKRHVFYNQMVANNKGITLVLEATMEHINFDFDENHLSEVINNLLTNAIKFSFKNSEIKIRITEIENNKIKTEIIDCGKGIPVEEHSKLFNYFQKTSTKPTAGEQSTGLGLAISKKIMTEHNGVIGVISEANKGSNFYFELTK
jgi:signal transduction histidine kinase